MGKAFSMGLDKCIIKILKDIRDGLVNGVIRPNNIPNRPNDYDDDYGDDDDDDRPHGPYDRPDRPDDRPIDLMELLVVWF